MDEIPKTKMLEESPGVTSSKRTMGTIAMSAGIGLLVFTGIAASLKTGNMINGQLALQSGTTLSGIGAALLGTTVIEHFRK